MAMSLVLPYAIDNRQSLAFAWTLYPAGRAWDTRRAFALFLAGIRAASPEKGLHIELICMQSPVANAFQTGKAALDRLDRSASISCRMDLDRPLANLESLAIAAGQVLKEAHSIAVHRGPPLPKNANLAVPDALHESMSTWHDGLNVIIAADRLDARLFRKHR